VIIRIVLAVEREADSSLRDENGLLGLLCPGLNGICPNINPSMNDEERVSPGLAGVAVCA